MQPAGETTARMNVWFKQFSNKINPQSCLKVFTKETQTVFKQCLKILNKLCLYDLPVYKRMNIPCSNCSKIGITIKV